MTRLSVPRLIVVTTLAMLAFAGNSLLCRVALRDTAIDAASFTSIRLASGALILALIVRVQKGRLAGGGSWKAAACLFAYAAGFSFAYRQLSAATGALLLFGAVQTAMLSYGIAKGERLRPFQLAGLLVAVGGLVYMLLPGLAAPPIEGSAFMIAAGIAWAGYSLLGRGTRDPTAATAGNFLRAVPFAAASASPSPPYQRRPNRRALCGGVGRRSPRAWASVVVRRAALTHRRIGRRDPAQRAGNCRIGRCGSAGRTALEPPDDRIGHDLGRHRADHLASPRLTGG
jgi:drug/metabolite transporter (DMT)-like permease